MPGAEHFERLEPPLTSNELDEYDRVRLAVERAADQLLARGVMPTLAHIEAAVKAPRHLLAESLKKWAGQLVDRLERPNTETPALPRQVRARAASEQYIVDIAGLAKASSEEALAAKQTARRLEEQRELRFEIDRAQEKLAQYLLRVVPARQRETRASTIAKIRTRIAAIQARLDELAADSSHPGIQATNDAAGDE